MQIPYEKMLEKVSRETNTSQEELNKKIDAKMNQLAGLISKEGAIHIIANEMGIKLFDNFYGRLKIKDILTGLRNIETIGKVQQVYELRNFVTKERESKLLSFVIADETETIRVVAWGSKADECSGIKKNDIILLKNTAARENQGRKEIHVGDRSNITINPANETDINIAKPAKKISELKENENVEIIGTIIQLFEPKFFEICPECNKKAKIKEEEYTCEMHGKIIPNYSYIINFTLDDGTGTIRCVCFKNQAEKFLELKHSQIVELREHIDTYKQIQERINGLIIKIEGRVSNNTFFNRLDIIINNVCFNPDLHEELKRLNNEFEEMNVLH